MKTPKFYRKDGKEDTARAQRYSLIVSGLARIKNTDVYCPTLKRPVIITKDSIEELAYHASKSEKSTNAALDVVHQIKIAKMPHFDIPKEGKQRRLFRFEMIITMQGQFKKSKTKITVGVRASGNVIQYCLTVPDKKEK